MQKFSYLSEKCCVRQSAINETGVFAKKAIKSGEFIAAWGGKICDRKEMFKIFKKNGNALNHPISIFDNLYLVTPNNKIEPADRFNHSCNPNAGVKGQIILIARKNIGVGNEITFDYETTQVGNLDGLPFNCKCGWKNCRKKINGHSWQNVKFIKKNKKFLSWYIFRKIQPSI